MTAQLPYSFFILRTDGTVQRVNVEQELQQQLTALFNGQRADLLPQQVEEVPFTAETPTADAGEVLTIADFTLPADITTAVNNPNATAGLIFTTADAYQIKSIFAVVQAQRPQVLFQAFDRRRVLGDQAGRFAITHSQGTFRRLEDPALVLDSRLAMIYQGGTLYFRSYQVANHIVDLSQYYREASNDEITAFLNEGGVGCDAVGDLLDNIDTVGRKKFALVRESGVLDTVPVNRIVAVAGRHKVKIKTERVNGGVRIVLPSERKELKAVLSFLNQDIYHPPLTKEGRFLSRSKVRMKD